MTRLKNVSDEFLNWLEQCPVEWSLVDQDEYSVTYTFKKEVMFFK